MERTAADAMPDDTDLTPQEPEPAETTTDTSTETSTDTTAETDANPVMALALKDLQERRTGDDPYWRAICRDALRLSQP